MLIAGVDEVGRGPLAGPVIAAAVILCGRVEIKGLADSKKLSATRREALSEELFRCAMAIGIGHADPGEIDRINILQASLLAMQRAIYNLEHKPDRVLVDGNCAPDISYPVQCVVRGDASVPAISAASIVAKVYRDRIMQDFDIEYPDYGFARHKGYPTSVHLAALKEFGPCPIHRRSFGPVQYMYQQQNDA